MQGFVDHYLTNIVFLGLPSEGLRSMPKITLMYRKSSVLWSIFSIEFHFEAK